MGFKKLISILLVIALILSLCACSKTNSEKDDASKTEDTSLVQDITDSQPQQSTDTNVNSGPLLYKVTDASGNCAYLFGSVHVGRESFYPLPDSVINAFDSSDKLAVEFDIIAFEKDVVAQTEAMTVMMYSDLSQISDRIDSEIYEAAVEILKKENTYFDYLDYFCPSLWSSLIDSIVYEKVNLDTNSGIDRHLIQRAYEKNKQVVDVESAKFQYSMMAQYSDELQELLLAGSVETYNSVQTEEGKKEFLDELNLLLDAWESGDANKIDELANTAGEFEDEKEEQLYNEYQKAMITDRNIGMADYAETALRSGKTVFICVGAAHVVGQGGMVDLLQNRGYTVEVVK